MAGETATIAGFNSSMGFPSTNISGSGYPLDQTVSLMDIIGPTESNRSNTYICDIMFDPRKWPSLDELLDPSFFVKMPYSNKTRVEVKINSIIQGTLRAPDFEGP